VRINSGMTISTQRESSYVYTVGSDKILYYESGDSNTSVAETRHAAEAGQA